MNATLYVPNHCPVKLSASGFVLPDANGYAKVSHQVASELGCVPGLVDVLVSGSGYVAYSVFDCEVEVNVTAMSVLQSMGVYESTEDAELCLRGPVLVVTLD
ncbi:hypothetical protein K3G63_14745 [Hymenobacter sp. HSC-4F20]|uniref:hypothetical protein n=1 Tax=Hymenobacter sp. HSC-4F20 TaxID=2864135 RepID=UPI001C7384EA|nr:hypothetical protein [Hymenobacter sp. HSC-4F20]MBX0291706.1 hypothetical protein [Hymenobacter sp. HSC-4F20]